MEIGVIGLNENALALCRHGITKGHKIFFADLHIYSGDYTLAKSMGPEVSLFLPENVARLAEIIVLAVPPENLYAAIVAMGKVKHKIIIDLIAERPRNTAQPSSFYELQRLLPDSKVVKVTTDAPHHLEVPEEKPTILYFFGNDRVAQRTVQWTLDGSAFNAIDANL